MGEENRMSISEREFADGTSYTSNLDSPQVFDKFDDYIRKLDKRKSFVNKLRTNYERLWKMSDDELRLNSNQLINPVYNQSNEVYLKINHASDLCFDENLFPYLITRLNKLENRTMKEDEYNYLLNNSIEKIIEDKKGKIVLKGEY